METDSSVQHETVVDVLNIASLGEGDVLNVQTESGSVYGFTVSEYIDVESHPDLSIVRSELSRVSDHEPVPVNDFEATESPTVTLEGSCNGAMIWGTSALATDRSPEITIGRAVAYRNDKGNLIMTSRVVSISVIRSSQPSRSNRGLL